MNTCAIILFALPFLAKIGDGAKILAVLPMPAGSHHNVLKPIMKELANRGHDLTVITLLPDDNANYKQIVLDKSILTILVDEKIDFFEMRKANWFQTFYTITNIGEKLAKPVVQSSQVQEILLSKNLEFDLILVEATFYQEVYVVFGHRFNAPVVEITTLSATFWLNYLMSNPYPLSYSVDYLCPLTDKMNFLERLQNTLLGISIVALQKYYNVPKHQALADQYVRYPGWETRPPVIELLSNISLAILSTHIAMHYPHPNNPNLIEVAGLHIKPPKKLPEDLQNYLDNATEGVIYFSFGSNVQGSQIPEKTNQALISAFSKLPFKFLWKWETESLPNQPSNVKISKWFPQTDVLAHKNIKGFISHGGINSLTESVYHGVPLVVVPLFADQLKNSKQVEAAGYGLTLLFDNITEESVLWAVNEITKPYYQEAGKKQSALLRDNPLPPLDTAMYWIEYVIRHKGAPHLRTAAAGLAWYQYFLVDVFAFIIGALILAVLIIYLSVKALFNFLCKSKSDMRTIKKKTR